MYPTRSQASPSGNFYRQNWEQEYGVARRNEIEVKQKLVDAYRDILPALNEAYLPKFYPDYVHFPARSQAAASKVVELIGALNLHDGFLDNKVEILISDGLLTRMGSQFGHVAINIGGVIYGRAPDVYAPADIDNFLQHSKQVIDINAYPKKQLLRASARMTLNA